jgi:hypothetical protein
LDCAIKVRVSGLCEQEKVINDKEKIVCKYVKNSRRIILSLLSYSLPDNFRRNSCVQLV